MIGKSIRYILSSLLISSLLISGCSNQSQNQPETNGKEKNSAQSDSQNKTNQDNNRSSRDSGKQENSSDSNPDSTKRDESDQGSVTRTPSNSETPNIPEGVKEKEFGSVTEAANYINSYQKIKQTNLELSDEISALRDAGAGHKYISWNEGNWYITLDYPTDPQYALNKNVDEKKLAENIVEYLDTHYLPAPKEKGIIKIRGFKNSPQTKIQWQKDRVVYEIVSNQNNPLETIKKAVEAGKALN